MQDKHREATVAEVNTRGRLQYKRVHSTSENSRMLHGPNSSMVEAAAHWTILLENSWCALELRYQGGQGPFNHFGPE